MNREKIEQYLKSWDIISYTINDDLSVDSNCSVYIGSMGLTEIPVQFNKVKGFFDCSQNKLTTLKGCPIETTGFFDCSENLLTSLEGSPKKVGGFFNAYKNKLITLDGSPKVVNGDVDVRFNDIKHNWVECEMTGGYYTSLVEPDMLLGKDGRVKNIKDWRYMNRRRYRIKNILRHNN